MHGPKRPNHAGQNHDRINKKKKKVQLPRGYWLHVLLNRAEDFDLPNPPPERWTRLHGGYQVNVRLSSEKVYRSKIKKKNEDGDAVWGEEFEMLVDAQATGELMIHVELERIGVVEEPGSSTLWKVIGRVRYKLAQMSQFLYKKRDFVLSLCLCNGGTIHFFALLKPIFIVD